MIIKQRKHALRFASIGPIDFIHSPNKDKFLAFCNPNSAEENQIYYLTVDKFEFCEN